MIALKQIFLKNYFLDSVYSTQSSKIDVNLDLLDGISPMNSLQKILLYAKDN